MNLDMHHTPHPDLAYGLAPSLRAEAVMLMRLRDQTTADGPLLDRREYLLRRAAVLDRLDLASPGAGHAEAAVAASAELQEYDRGHGTWSGRHSPDVFRWDPREGPRAYVRQEYSAWRGARFDLYGI